MTREEFLKQSQSEKTGLTKEQMIHAIAVDVKKCEFLLEKGEMYSVKSLINDFQMNYNIKKCMIAGCIRPTIDYLQREDNIESGKKMLDNMLRTCIGSDILVTNGFLKPFEFSYIFFQDVDVKALMKIAEMDKEEFIGRYLMNHMFPDYLGKYKSEIKENANSVKSLFINSKLSEDKILAEDVGIIHTDKLNNIVEFSECRDISKEEANRILETLLSSYVQQKLKEFKARDNKEKPRFTEITDFEFDKEKYNFTFIVDSMYKGKKIVILLNSKETKNNVEIVFLN